VPEHKFHRAMAQSAMAVVEQDFGVWLAGRHSGESIACPRDRVLRRVRALGGNCCWTEFPEVSNLLEVKKVAGETLTREVQQHP
jgi:hypothetical protein